MASKCLALRLVTPMDGNTDWSGVKDVTPGGGSRWSPVLADSSLCVPKVCQKCMPLAEKGFDFERKQKPRMGVRLWKGKQ